MERQLNLKLLVKINFFLVILLITVTSFSFEPPTMTGAPGEGNCFNCHISTSTDSEVLLLKEAGATYQSNQVYDFTLNIKNPGAEIFGFIITEVNADLATRGSFQHSDSTRYSEVIMNVRQYLSHFRAEDTANRRTDSTQFNFTWTAPDTSYGDITFYYCARAVNPNDLENDMLTYCDSLTITPSTWPLGLEPTDNLSANALAFPNPGTSELNLRGISEAQSIRVVNATGKVMHEGTVRSDFESIQTEEWPIGLYFIHLEGPQNELLKWVKL